MKARDFLLLFFAVLSRGGGALADESWIGGRAFTNLYAPIEGLTTEELLQSRSSAWLDLQPKFGEQTQGRIILTADALSSSRVDFGVREAYVQGRSRGFEWKAGRQIIPWGKSDGLNPTDFFGARDFQNFNPDDEVRRLAGTNFSVAFTPRGGVSPFRITMIAQPQFPGSRLVIPARLIPSELQALGIRRNENSVRQGGRLGDSELGAEMAYMGDSFDLSFHAFRGYAHQPYLQLRGNELVDEFQAIRALGMNASWTLGQENEWVVRLESAYIDTDRVRGLAQPSHWDTILGLERTFFQDFRLQLQGIARTHFGWQNPAQLEGFLPAELPFYTRLSTTNALLLNYQERTRIGGSFRLAYQSPDFAWEPEIGGIGYVFGGSDYLFRPRLHYRWSDALRLTTGADVYGGDRNRPLGALYSISALYLQAMMFF